MEAEDIQKLAARMGKPEKDVGLALHVAKNDVAEAERLMASTVAVVKGCYSAKTNRMHGGILILFDTAARRIHRIRAISTYDADYGSLSLSMDWPGLEKKIFEAELKENFVPAISHDLAGEIEYLIQENMDEFIPLFNAGVSEELSGRLRRTVCTCLGDSDVDCAAVVEKITPLDLKIADHEVKPEDVAAEAAPAAGEGGAAPAAGSGAPPSFEDARNLVLKTDVVLSPVAGTAASTLNPGDFILVKITDTRPQANYISNLLHAVENGRPIPVRVPIRKIERSESQRLVITTEFGPGVVGKTVVQESLKLKTAMEAGASLDSAKLPKGPIVLIVMAALVVLILMMVVVYYVTTLI